MNVAREAEYKRIVEALRDPQRRSWIMFNPTSIGDTATVCALAAAFVKRHGHSITMVVPPDHLPVTQMYPNRFARVLTMDRQAMLGFMYNYLDSDRFELDVPFCAHPYDLGDGRSDGLAYLFKFPGRGGLTFTDNFRHVLRLPWDAELERPQIPAQWDLEARQLADQVGMKVGASVTLFPATSSPHPQFPDVFWATLAERLAQRGYKVFTNMKGGNFRPQTMPIVGTTPVEVPVHLSLSLVRYAGRTISPANGMQFLQLLGGKFKQMTVAMPISGQRTEFELNSRIYHSTAIMAQYMCPELCVGLPFVEVSVPFDGPEEELRRLAILIADESFDDPSCIRRLGNGNRSYLDEHASWLSQLIQPPPLYL